jgi:hypothetical protein
MTRKLIPKYEASCTHGPFKSNCKKYNTEYTLTDSKVMGKRENVQDEA